MSETLTFRGIEITAANWRHVKKHAGIHSDIALRAEVAFSVGGWARAAGYLLEVPEDVRADVESDGTIQGNVEAGWRYADAIHAAVTRWNRGDHSLRFVAANREMLERERAATRATGVFRPESTDRAFGHVAVVGRA